MCTIAVISSGKRHGLVLLNKTKNDDFPNRLACEFVSKAKKPNMASDVSTLIELVEVDKLKLKGARIFFNELVREMDMYEVTQSDCELCATSPDFASLCNDMPKIQ